MNSLKWHSQQDRFHLYAFVVMPTHFHCLIKPAQELSISRNLQSLGSFTAHALLKALRAADLHTELRDFAGNRIPDKSEAHQIWQPFQAKNIQSIEFLREKLEYIHNNPVAKKWRLAMERSAYEFSSACFYDSGQTPVIPVEDVRQWMV
ncbi:MAG: transposase [Anaerolineales bacterium]